MAIEDLIPTSERSVEEAKEMGRKGGIASGEARREKAKLKRIIAAYLDTKDSSGIDNETKIVLAVGDKAYKGDVKAAEFLADRLYDKPRQATDVTLDKPQTLQDWYNETSEDKSS